MVIGCGTRLFAPGDGCVQENVTATNPPHRSPEMGDVHQGRVVTGVSHQSDCKSDAVIKTVAEGEWFDSTAPDSTAGLKASVTVNAPHLGVTAASVPAECVGLGWSARRHSSRQTHSAGCVITLITGPDVRRQTRARGGVLRRGVLAAEVGVVLTHHPHRFALIRQRERPG